LSFNPNARPVRRWASISEYYDELYAKELYRGDYDVLLRNIRLLRSVLGVKQ